MEQARVTKETVAIDDLLTVDELAEKLKLRVSWVYARTRERGPDTIPVLRCGKYLRFSYPSVLEWLRRVDG